MSYACFTLSYCCIGHNISNYYVDRINVALRHQRALLSLMGCFEVVTYLKCLHQDLKNDSSTNSVAYPEVKL